MNNPYIKDLIVRLTVGLPIHAADVDWLLPTLEALDKYGGIEEVMEVSEQEGYERGYTEAKGDAEAQIESLISDHEDWPENVISTLEDFEVER